MADMADPANKAILKQIHALKREIGTVNAEHAEWAGNLPELEEMVASGEGGSEIVGIRDDCVATLAGMDEKLAKLNADLALLEEKLPKKPEPAAPKFDPEKHPLLKKASENAELTKPVEFHTGDMCEAQWTDKQWYKAKVQMVLGSASARQYNVRFVDYQESLTVSQRAIRPIYTNDKKRKLDSIAGAPNAIPTMKSSTVISGPASINPDAVAANKKPDAPANGRKKRTIGGKEALNRKAQGWNNFLSSGLGKKTVARKESMFRSGTGAGSKVGFVNSGHGMTQTAKRVRYDKKKDMQNEREHDEDY